MSKHLTRVQIFHDMKMCALDIKVLQTYLSYNTNILLLHSVLLKESTDKLISIQSRIMQINTMSSQRSQISPISLRSRIQHLDSSLSLVNRITAIPITKR
jgi:hypothetical protein